MAQNTITPPRPRIFPRVIQLKTENAEHKDLCKTYSEIAQLVNNVRKGSIRYDLFSKLLERCQMAIKRVEKFFEESTITKSQWQLFHDMASPHDKANVPLSGERQAVWELIRALRIAGELMMEVKKEQVKIEPFQRRSYADVPKDSLSVRDEIDEQVWLKKLKE